MRNEIPSLALLNELFDYNYWARDRQLQASAALTEEQFLQPLRSSFSSIRDTFAHLIAAEWMWLECWRGHLSKPLLSGQEFPTLEAASNRWRAVEREMRQYLAGLTEETF